MFWFTLSVVLSFVPPPPPEGSWKIAFVLHLGRSFQLQMQCEVGELVLQGGHRGAHLGLRSVSGGGLLLRSDNGSPGPPGRGSEFSELGNVNVSVEGSNSISILFPGGTGRKQTGWHPHLGPGPVCGRPCRLGGSHTWTLGPSAWLGLPAAVPKATIPSGGGMCGFG